MTGVSLIRAAMIVALIYFGYRNYRDSRTGHVKVSWRLPGVVLDRRTNPVAFWCYVICGYVVIALLIALVWLGYIPVARR